MADVETQDIDQTQLEQDRDDVAEVGVADEGVKFVEDEELTVNGSSRTGVDALWMLRIPNDLYAQMVSQGTPGQPMQIAKLRCWNDGSFEIIMPPTEDDSSQETPMASSSQVKQEEQVYGMRETVIPPNKESKWAYFEDERKHRWAGKTTERARPRLVDRVRKEFVLARKMTAAGTTMALKAANLKEQQKKKLSRKVDDIGLTQAQQNILATGGYIEPEIRRRAAERKVEKKVVKERVYRILPTQLQDILYEEFNRFKYWKMNTLVERLKQPASWIRQNLKSIAVREETGPYANYWRLHDRFINIQGEAENAGTAPEHQDYSDSAQIALRNKQYSEEDDMDVDPTVMGGGNPAGGSVINLDDADPSENGSADDDDDDMEEINA